MSSTGTQADRNQTVASVASLLFGASITEHDVIGETLQRVTNPGKDVQAIKLLLKSVLLTDAHAWVDFEAFSDDPLAIWVELTLGIELPADEPPRRAKPITLKDAAGRLAPRSVPSPRIGWRTHGGGLGQIHAHCRGSCDTKPGAGGRTAEQRLHRD